MPYLYCDKKYFSYKNLKFHNGKHLYRKESDYLYKLATKVPVDRAIIKNEKGEIINKPVEIPDENSTLKYTKLFVKLNDLDENIDLRKSKEDIIKQIEEQLNLNEGEQDGNSS